MRENDLIRCYFDGEALRPDGNLANAALHDRLGAGEVVFVDVDPERSGKSHRHQFAFVRTAWLNLPEAAKDAPFAASAEHLRKHALIVTGFRNVEMMPCGTPARAERFVVSMSNIATRLNGYTSNTAGGQGDVRTPIKTVTAGGGHSALVAPVLTYAQQGGGNRDIRDPHHTICASTKDQNMVLAPGLVHIGNGERPGQAPRCYDPAAPLGTIVAAGPRQYPFAAFLAQQNTGLVGHDARAPISTIVGKGCTQTPVAAWFAKYYGTGDGARQDEPCHTVTTRDRFGHAQAELAAPPFTDAHAARAREVAEFLREHGAWSGGEFVTLEIEGETFVVVDIGLRMLTPRELFNAQGFPPDYVIEGVWRQDEAGEWAGADVWPSADGAVPPRQPLCLWPPRRVGRARPFHRSRPLRPAAGGRPARNRLDRGPTGPAPARAGPVACGHSVQRRSRSTRPLSSRRTSTWSP